MSVIGENVMRYKKIFDECDTNQDDLISFCELKYYLKSKEHSKDLSLRQITYIFSLNTKDEKKLVTFDDFVRIIEHPNLQFLIRYYVQRYVNFLIPQPKPKPKKKFQISEHNVEFPFAPRTLDLDESLGACIQSDLLKVLHSTVKDYKNIFYLDQLTFLQIPNDDHQDDQRRIESDEPQLIHGTFKTYQDISSSEKSEVGSDFRKFLESSTIRKDYAYYLVPRSDDQRRNSIEPTVSQLIQGIARDQKNISYSDELTLSPPPFALVFITIMEVVLFSTDEFVLKKSTSSGTGIIAQVFLYEPSKRQQAWRFLTYMFVHTGYVHIVVNMAFQLLFGLPLEMVHRWWRVSLLYFAGVIAGSLATSVTDPWVKLAGASAGVYALLTAHISTIIINWSEMTMPYLQLGILLIIVGFDLGSSIYDRYFLNIHNQVGYAAHFGGAVAGLLVGIYLLRNLNVKKCEKYLWWAALVIYVVLMTVAILMNIFLPGRYPPRAK
ncbi:hypothetical protein ABEB36_006975 [Hypothenemus hampei]|uniref:EF-hand domain-containing protein n=1 Tax=Hypothenemus hampei TaxID=57062 RepID=A0ABD1ESB5_HYPHA